MTDFLAAKGVAFVKKDPMIDTEAETELAALGLYATPGTLFDSAVVVGFDAETLPRLVSDW